MKSKDIFDNIVNNRSLFWGISILLILLYHQPDYSLIKGIYFYPGFVGVDVFLFFSGYGLCFSINKHSLIDFYKRRLERILPLYLLMAILCSLVLSFRGEKVYTIWDYFCNLTTLSYYGLGGDVFEWFLSALFLLYLIFPLLYQSINIITPKLVGGGTFDIISFSFNSFLNLRYTLAI